MFSGALMIAAIVRRPLGRGPDVDDLDAIRSSRDELEVRLNLVRCSQPSVVAHAKAEVGLRRRNLGSSEARRQQDERDERNDDDAAPRNERTPRRT